MGHSGNPSRLIYQEPLVLPRFQQGQQACQSCCPLCRLRVSCLSWVTFSDCSWPPSPNVLVGYCAASDAWTSVAQRQCIAISRTYSYTWLLSITQAALRTLPYADILLLLHLCVCCHHAMAMTILTYIVYILKKYKHLSTAV